MTAIQSPQQVDQAQPLSTHEMIGQIAARSPDAVALLAHGQPPLTYSRLYRHVSDITRTLNGAGIGRNDRVVTVLPEGPNAAAALVAIASCATVVPLNPAFRAEEFTIYLANLGPKALLVPAGVDSPAVGVSERYGIPVVRVCPLAGADAGLFCLDIDEGIPVTNAGLARGEDIALVLHTSGTTSRPKVVALTQRNLGAMAHRIQTPFRLDERDRLLNALPLFHTGGIGALLASLRAGASVICSSSFSPSQFFDLMEEFGPTWYYAVPTMHEAIVAQAAAHRDLITRHPLRFVRSGTGPLSERLRSALERTFRAPVVVSYGLTEATSIASSPLPPSPRKAGSVGVAIAAEIGILHETGNMLAAGDVGEVAVRGQDVVAHYENDTEDATEALIDGWFRTGDQGYLDADGYLFLTGRLKDVIRRGSETISPGEVEEALLEHPAVAQAAAFPLPHKTLAEDVAAAVVLLEGAAIDERELLSFVATRLTDFKVPRRIVFVDALPTNSVGKVQRSALAEAFASAVSEGNALTRDVIGPHTPVEARVADVWAEVLKLGRVAVDERFLDLGGDSIRAGLVVARLQETMSVELSLSDFFETATVAQMALLISEQLATQTRDTDRAATQDELENEV